MKKTILYALSALALMACNEKKAGYEITGTVDRDDLNGKYVYLYEYGVRDAKPVDSALVENKAFTLKGVQDSAALRYLTFGEGVIDMESYMFFAGYAPYTPWFVLDNSKLTVVMAENPSVTGNTANNELAAFMAKMDELEKEAAPINQEAEDAEQQYKAIFDKRTAAAKEFIQQHNNSLEAAVIFSDIQYELPEADRRAIIEKAGDVFKSAPRIDKIIQQLEVLAKVAVGMKFTDFELNDPKGQPHKLSDYAGTGKVVLIDFWASWCGPCRQDMPNLVALYNDYKAKSFEIVGVSLDENVADWEKAITDLKITWPQMSDLQRWKNAAAVLYGVNGIPHTVLLDKEGNIVAKDLHGDELKAKIEELLK